MLCFEFFKRTPISYYDDIRTLSQMFIKLGNRIGCINKKKKCNEKCKTV